MDERTLGAVAGPNIGTMVLPPLERCFFLVETELAFLFVRAMALNAFGLENRFDIPREYDWALRSGGEFGEIGIVASRTLDGEDSECTNEDDTAAHLAFDGPSACNKHNYS